MKHHITNSLDAFREENIEPLHPEERKVSGVTWKNWGPDMSGEVSPCFKGGFLFRIFSPQKRLWALYNDTYVYEMHSTFTLAADAQFEPAPGVEKVTLEDGQIQLTVVVYPMETKVVMEGDRLKFRSVYDGRALSAEYLESKAREAEKNVVACTNLVRELTSSMSDEEVLQRCIKEDLMFVDPSFPPSHGSIDPSKKMTRSPWQRPSDYLPKRFHKHIRLFRSPITPDSTQRGDLGDSWVISGIAAIAENEKHIKDLFRHPSQQAVNTLTEEKHGAHRIMMNTSGLWRSVIIDDYLPILGNQPRFARSSKDYCETWVSMLEKAYAKRNRGYSKIISGDPLFAIRDFTGFPTCRLDAKFREGMESPELGNQFYERLLADYENGHMILFSTPGNSDARSKSPRYTENGVFIGYAYSVIEVAKVGDVKLLRLRNPWASSSVWKGRWAPGSELWARNPEIAAAFPGYDTVDHSFIMDWEETLNFFVGCGVVFNHFNYADYRISSQFTGAAAGVCLKVTVTEPTTLTIILSHEDRRGTPKEKEDYIPIMLSLASRSNEEKNEYTLVTNSTADIEHPSSGFTFLQGRDIYLMHTFTPEKSPYMIIPRRLYSESQTEEVPFVLGVLAQLPFTPYGQAQVHLCKPGEKNKVFSNYLTFIDDAEDVTLTFQVKNKAAVNEVTSNKLN
ncbi:calpain-like cysteine peptidase [Angomonas deanei]|nr:calpain-like cysteine peptidase [Angomonas deanei]|eukprot:EPY26455.1 calpain-like cysteine peptidase [Angomonas deanei]